MSCLRKLSQDSINSNQNKQIKSSEQKLADLPQLIEFLPQPCQETITVQQNLLEKLENQQNLSFLSIAKQKTQVSQKQELIKQLILHQKSQYQKVPDHKQSQQNCQFTIQQLMQYINEMRGQQQQQQSNEQSEISDLSEDAVGQIQNDYFEQEDNSDYLEDEQSELNDIQNSEINDDGENQQFSFNSQQQEQQSSQQNGDNSEIEDNNQE